MKTALDVVLSSPDDHLKAARVRCAFDLLQDDPRLKEILVTWLSFLGYTVHP